MLSGLGYLVHCGSLHADPVEVWAAIGRGNVRVTGRTGLANEVALNGSEGRKIGATLEIVRPCIHALPS